MPLVNIMVNQRAYTIACDEGEEEHLRELSKHVDTKVRELLGTVGQVGDARLLLMAALLITDDYLDAVEQRNQRNRLVEELTQARDEAEAALNRAEAEIGRRVESAGERVDALVRRLADA